MSYGSSRGSTARLFASISMWMSRCAVTNSAMTRLISNIASRFGVAVSEKVAAQAVPIVGAIGGGLINALFVDHFQNTADAHFTVRSLERKYGADVVKQQYEQIARGDAKRLAQS